MKNSNWKWKAAIKLFSVLSLFLLSVPPEAAGENLKFQKLYEEGNLALKGKKYARAEKLFKSALAASVQGSEEDLLALDSLIVLYSTEEASKQLPNSKNTLIEATIRSKRAKGESPEAKRQEQNLLDERRSCSEFRFNTEIRKIHVLDLLLSHYLEYGNFENADSILSEYCDLDSKSGLPLVEKALGDFEKYKVVGLTKKWEGKRIEMVALIEKELMRTKSIVAERDKPETKPADLIAALEEHRELLKCLHREEDATIISKQIDQLNIERGKKLIEESLAVSQSKVAKLKEQGAVEGELLRALQEYGQMLHSLGREEEATPVMAEVDSIIAKIEKEQNVAQQKLKEQKALAEQKQRQIEALAEKKRALAEQKRLLALQKEKQKEALFWKMIKQKRKDDEAAVRTAAMITAEYEAGQSAKQKHKLEFQISRADMNLTGRVFQSGMEASRHDGYLKFRTSSSVDIGTDYSRYNGIDVGILAGTYEVGFSRGGLPVVRIHYTWGGAQQVAEYTAMRGSDGRMFLSTDSCKPLPEWCTEF